MPRSLSGEMNDTRRRRMKSEQVASATAPGPGNKEPRPIRRRRPQLLPFQPDEPPLKATRADRGRVSGPSGQSSPRRPGGRRPGHSDTLSITRHAVCHPPHCPSAATDLHQRPPPLSSAPLPEDSVTHSNPPLDGRKTDLHPLQQFHHISLKTLTLDKYSLFSYLRTVPRL